MLDLEVGRDKMDLVKEMSKRQERLHQDGYEAGLRCQPGRQPREAVEGDIAAWQRGYESGKAVRLQKIKEAQARGWANVRRGQ